MAWSSGSWARAPLAAGALAVLAVAQSGAGTGLVVSDGPAVDEGAVVERPQELLLAVLLALATTAPLALAGLWPVLGAGLSATAVLVCLLTQVPLTLGGLLALGASYVVAGLRSGALVTVGLVAPFVVCAVLPVANRPGTVAVLAVAVLGGAAGVGWRTRAEARRRDAEVEAAQESQREHLARGERARITRELHDVVAHHVSLIALQAESARLTVPGMPPEGEKRLLAIGDTARTALAEMRRLLGVLRADVDASDMAVRQPQPGLLQLVELLDDVRDAGPGGTRLIVRGAVVPLDHGVELTAYRIVQEALTNARRHAPGAPVDVELEYRADRLVVRVRDVGPGPSPGGAGHGLPGMRERAAAVGGSLWAGPGPVGGFVVRAELPTGATP